MIRGPALGIRFGDGRPGENTPKMRARDMSCLLGDLVDYSTTVF